MHLFNNQWSYFEIIGSIQYSIGFYNDCNHLWQPTQVSRKSKTLGSFCESKITIPLCVYAHVLPMRLSALLLWCCINSLLFATAVLLKDSFRIFRGWALEDFKDCSLYFGSTRLFSTPFSLIFSFLYQFYEFYFKGKSRLPYGSTKLFSTLFLSLV